MSLFKKTLLICTFATLFESELIYIIYYFIYFNKSHATKFSLINFPITIAFIILLSVILSSIIVIFLQLTVLSKIQTIESHVNRIAETEDFDTEVNIKGTDELAHFAKQINRMIRVKQITDKALRESENLYKTILETSDNAFIILDTAFKPIFFNKKFHDLFGYKLEEIENKNLFDVISKDINQNKLKVFYDTGVSKTAGPTTLKLKTKTSEMLDIEALSSPISLKEKQFILFRLIDITEIKKLEAQSRENQLQLQQADKLASIGLLVAGVAHEINNPNSFISFNLPHIEKIFSEIIPILDEYARNNKEFRIGNISYNKFKIDLKDLLNDLKEGSNRITNIVNELKNFAKIDPEEETQFFDFKQIFNSAIRLLSPQIKKKNTKLEMNLTQSIFINGSSPKLGQVILNIISNALDAIKENEGIIKITSYFNGDKNFICEIIDNGCGIPNDKIRLVFDPFYTTKSNSGGTGLGLSVSRSIMKSMGFSINIKSVLEKGTTVILTFPKEYIR
jgi:PAS domain S-box-containing protein